MHAHSKIFTHFQSTLNATQNPPHFAAQFPKPCPPRVEKKSGQQIQTPPQTNTAELDESGILTFLWPHEAQDVDGHFDNLGSNSVAGKHRQFVGAVALGSARRHCHGSRPSPCRSPAAALTPQLRGWLHGCCSSQHAHPLKCRHRHPYLSNALSVSRCDSAPLGDWGGCKSRWKTETKTETKSGDTDRQIDRQRKKGLKRTLLLRYVGVIRFVFHVLQLLPMTFIHKETCVALTNLQRSITKNRIENRISTVLVTVVGNASSLIP